MYDIALFITTILVCFAALATQHPILIFSGFALCLLLGTANGKYSKQETK